MMTNQEAIEILKDQMGALKNMRYIHKKEKQGDIKWVEDQIDCYQLTIAALEKQEHEKWHVRPFEDDYPDNDRLILVSFENASGIDIARFRTDAGGGIFCPGDEDVSYKHYGIYVYAWRELPEEPPVEVMMDEPGRATEDRETAGKTPGAGK